MREVAGRVDLTGCSRRETDQPLVRTSKLGQDSIFKNYITVSPYIRCIPMLFPYSSHIRNIVPMCPSYLSPNLVS